MKVFIIDSQDYYESYLYLVEHVTFGPSGLSTGRAASIPLSVEAMQALLDLKWGPPKPPPPAGSGQWNTYRTGLHKVVGVGDIEWIGGPLPSNREPTLFRDFIEGLENSASGWMDLEHREAGRHLVRQLPPHLRALLPDLLIQGTAAVVEPEGFARK